MLAPWKKSYNKHKQHIQNQRHHFNDKGPSNQSYDFSSSHVQRWDWTIKKAESWRNDAFELWCWKRLLRVPWTAWRSNQSIIKEISPEYSLEGLMLKLKLQYFDHLMQRTDSCENTLLLGKTDGGTRRGWQRMRWLDGSLTRLTWVWASFRSWWWTGKPGIVKSQIWMNDWTAWKTFKNACLLNHKIFIYPEIILGASSGYILFLEEVDSWLFCSPV